MQDTGKSLVLFSLLKSFHLKERHSPTPVRSNLNSVAHPWSSKGDVNGNEFSTPKHDPVGGTAKMGRLNKEVRQDHHMAHIKTFQLQKSQPVR